MKETPIIFSGDMVNAILDGRKTMTRRVVTVPWGKGKRTTPYEPWYVEEDGKLFYQDEYGDYLPMEELSPYQIGNRLWVRETFSDASGFDIIYKADENSWVGKWKPSIFMPKTACRLWLDITSVRVERLQDISEDDAKAEGVVPKIPEYRYAHTTAFTFLWDLINGKKHPWDSNPWVWVVTFERGQ